VHTAQRCWKAALDEHRHGADPGGGAGSQRPEGLDIRALLAESLHMGDEGHNRNKAGSILYTAKSGALHIAQRGA
jgi:hypothetical protein